ncbi:MAG: flagellar hook capping FlgD N-terminal domain-containing protein [Shimia sp.]|uniref:flagellar hook capping FlgD N-terminal domain-containing protein n=1 Tax=unclassified Shimia TaxID=2630038 RepID=UPI0006B57F59|nr:flagellar hook capping FlgD N-terminal domain-containing protein [Shimia sp. SK013]KPA20318.1 Basal-body rod modification protein FlgD [Shimia sp. SK013]
MDFVTSQTTSTAATSVAAANSATSSSQGAISSDFETFLKMLTAQMQNQDPLDPTDSTEFASQLAQFSAVEQQVLTNETLSLVSQQLAAMGSSNMASWIGMEARVAGLANFDGDTPVEIYPMANNLADEAYLIVTDSDGNEIDRVTIDPSAETVTWDGLDDSGNPFPEGNYVFQTLSKADGNELDTVLAESYTLISEAQASTGGMVLIGVGGAKYLSADIVGLRQPDDAAT